MISKSILLLVTLSASLVSCIKNGQDATSSEEYPFYVMMGSPYICGGTLLSYDPAYVLTAAHCTGGVRHPKDIPIDKLTYHVQYGDIHRKNQTVNRIIDWVVNPNYQHDGEEDINYDSALLRLEKPIKKSEFVLRAALWNQAIEPHPITARHIGFGTIDIAATLPQTLQVVDFNITHIDLEAEHEISTRPINGSQISCHGDSGGPLFIRRDVTDPSTQEVVHNVPFVLGDLTRNINITPTGNGCPNPPGSAKDFFPSTAAFTNVAASFDWIANITGISKEDLIDPFYDPPCDSCDTLEENGYDAKDVRKWELGPLAIAHGLESTENIGV